MNSSFTVQSTLTSILAEMREDLFCKIAPAIAEAVDWEEVTPRKVTPIIEAIDRLPAREQRQLSETLQGIHLIASSKTCPNAIGRMVSGRGIPLPEDFATYNARSKATFGLLHLPETEWNNLLDEARRGEGYRRDLTVIEFELNDELIPYNPTDTQVNAFCAAVCRHTFKEEYRGQIGICERQRNEAFGQDIYTIYQNDHIRSRVTWDGEGSFHAADIPESSQITVTYFYNKHDLHISASRTSDSARRQIGQIWIREILGLNYVPIRDRTPFRIQQFSRQQTANVAVTGNEYLVSARIVAIEVQKPDRQAVRLTATATREGDAIEEIRSSLNGSGLTLEDASIRRLTFEVSYRDPRGRVKTVQCWVTPTTSNCDTRSDAAKQAVYRLMEEGGIHGTNR